MPTLTMQLAIFLLSSTLTLSAAANEVLIYAGDEYPPIIYQDEKKQAQGVLAQAVHNFEHFSGKKVKLELTSWRRAYEYSVKGRGGLIGLSKTKERQTIFDYSDIIYEDNINLVVRRDKIFNYQKLNDLKGKFVGVALGASYGDEVDSAIKQGLFKVDPSTNNVIRFKKLLSGRIDVAIVSNGQIGLEAIIQADPELIAQKDKLVILPTPLVRDPLYLGFPKSMQMGEFLLLFNESLKANKTPFRLTTE